MSLLRNLTALIALCLSASSLAADRVIILVTPSGVYQSTVASGVPGPWVPASNVDVIVQGFVAPGPSPPSPGPPVPQPPDEDPIVQRVAIAAKSLKDKQEATACAAMVNSLTKLGLSGADFVEALTLAAPIMDAQLGAEGRIIAFGKAATAITSDAGKLISGITAAWGVSLIPSLETIHREAVAKTDASALPAEAISLAIIIQVIQLIIELLTKLGVI